MQENKTISEKEQATNKFWKKSKIFEKSVEKKAPKGDYVFYDGPPFATGLPHYGHIVASIIKDVVPRFWTMNGFRVERKWGWDCHGLPIENIVEKELGTKTKKDIEKIGVGKYNEMCRAKILSYVSDWKKTIEKLGRWADMDKPYRTMDLEYMESVWWVFKSMYDNDLIYKGYRPIHICPRCETTLSQSEVTEGYKDVKDLSITAEFRLKNNPDTSILAWTTTPWTLIGNVALAVGKDIDYVKIEKPDMGTGKPVRFILAKEKLVDLFKDQEYKVLEELKGKDLVGLEYEPVFPYYKNSEIENLENAWKVYAGDFVNTEEGTGIVHIAPAFGEDDMNLGKQYNLPFIQHVNLDGTIKPEATDFAGLNVKPAGDTMATDIEILKYLNEKNLIFSKEKYLHSYPHCWRCDTPLLNYATDSWFVSVTKIKDRMLELAKDINWSPEHIKEGRWGNWLKGARDWSISRQRFWASVMPIWECECGERKVIGSIKELKDLSGQEVNDLHKHIVDEITFPCKCGKEMKRIPDVLDTWFDSGSMPFAQMHYPFENKEKFEQNFPAQFIAEGADQTRCWFYYMHILSTGVKNVNAFQNVIVNGIVLAEDGKKMSKKLQNYPDPNVLMDKYGADALRYYLLTSPVMLADNLNFSENGVRESYKKINILLSNICNFYNETPRKISETAKEALLDKWILSRLQTLLKQTTSAMQKYNLPQATRPIEEFISDLSTWYVRLNRERINDNDPAAIKTLKTILDTLSKILAPFTPFIAEEVYQTINNYNYKDETKSVHLQTWPEPNEPLINPDLETEMQITRDIVSAALKQRDKNQIGIKWPLVKATVLSPTEAPQEELQALIKQELNIKELEFKTSDNLEVQLDTNLTPKLEAEGFAREIARKIQSLRKESNLIKSDQIELEINSDFNDKLEDHLDSIKSQVGAEEISIEKSNKNFEYSKVGKIKNQNFEIRFNKL